MTDRSPRTDLGILRYPTIVADPPWSYTQSGIPTRAKSAKTRPEASAQYSTMTIAEMCLLDIPAADDAHLYMWATNPILHEAFEVMQAWGFTYRTLITWEKQGTLGMGFYFRGQTEHVLFGTRGKLPIAPALRERNIFRAPKTGHSIKPDAFMDMVERVSPGPYLEMFSRRARFGWDTWGDQALHGMGVPPGGPTDEQIMGIAS